MLKRFFIISMVSILLLTIPTACKNQPNQKVIIGVLQDVNSLPFIIADHMGYFKDNGIDVQVQLFSSAVERDAALQSGNIDGCMSDILGAVFAVQEGQDIKITSVTNGDYVLLVSKNSGINTVSDLKNIEIGLSTNTIIEYAADSIMTKNGIAPSEIKKIAVPKIPIRLEMLANEKLQAACLPQPLASLAQLKGAKVIATSTQEGLAPSVMVFRSTSIQQKKEELVKVYETYNHAAQLLNKDKAQFMDIIIEKAKFPVEIRDVLTLPQYSQANLPAQSDILNVLEWMQQKKLLKKDIQYDMLVEKGLFK